jgi:hypothetical protein
MSFQASFQMSAPRPREPLKGEDEIRALSASSELRCIALGSQYSALTLSDEQQAQVEDELRKARMFEVLSTTATMRRAEIDEVRRRILEGERSVNELRHRKAVRYQLLRQKAFECLQREAEAAKVELDSRLKDDRRIVLQREKEKLMERRRRFEVDQHDDISAVRSAKQPAPVLVMSVALGNGKEDRIIVRQNDDPRRVATQFAKTHKLPEHSIANLANQIRSNLNSSTQRTSTPNRSLSFR